MSHCVCSPGYVRLRLFADTLKITKVLLLPPDVTENHLHGGAVLLVYTSGKPAERSVRMG